MPLKPHEQHGRHANLAELSEMIDMEEGALKKLLEQFHATQCLSLDVKIGDQENSELLDLVPDHQQDLFEEVCDQNIREVLIQTLDRFKEKEATVIRLRFGLDDNQPKTLSAIGEELGLTRERIRQIESKALKQLRYSEIVRSLQAVA